MVTSNTLVLVLLASRAHAYDMLLVSVLVSKVELKLSNSLSWPFSGLSNLFKRFVNFKHRKLVFAKLICLQHASHEVTKISFFYPLKI